MAFYVSPTGNDSNPGSIQAPFKTLKRARTAMRASATVKTTYLLAGTHRLGSTPLILDYHDVNTRWLAWPGANAPIVRGTATNLFVLRQANGVTISGLTFTNTATGHLSDWSEGVLRLEGVSNATITLNNFTNVGMGIGLLESHSNTIANNNFQHIQGIAVQFQQSNGNTFTENVVQFTHEGSVVPNVTVWGAVAITQGHSNTISHNYVSDIPGLGISVMNDEPDAPKEGPNIIEYNRVARTCQELSDAGAIYEWSLHAPDHGNDIIRYNHVTDTGWEGSWGFGIYLDDRTSGTVVEGNFVKGSAAGNLMIHGGSNIVVANNVLIEPGINNIYLQNEAEWPVIADVQIERNITHVPSGHIGMEFFDFEPAPEMMPPSNVHHNLYWVIESGIPVGMNDEDIYDDWQSQGGDAESIIDDPLFVDPDGGDYRLRPDSPAYGLGFVDLPWEEMGGF